MTATLTAPTAEQTETEETLVTDEMDVPVLEMVQPLAGFPDQRHFALARLDGSGIVCDLRSLDDPDLRFVVVPPAAFFADYSPEIDDSVTEQLGLESEDDLLALLVVTLGATPDTATANLLAPVLVNHRTRLAGQFLLSDGDLPTRAPLAARSGGAA